MLVATYALNGPGVEKAPSIEDAILWVETVTAGAYNRAFVPAPARFDYR